jgi:hypothetical protein
LCIDFQYNNKSGERVNSTLVLSFVKGKVSVKEV